MCPTMSNHRLAVAVAAADVVADVKDWKQESIHGGSLPRVDLETGMKGWSSPPGHLFNLRSQTYFSNNNNEKSPSGDWLLEPAGVDWLRSTSRLDNVLARPDNRVTSALRKAHSVGTSLKTFLLAVNLQIPGREHHSVVSYFSTDEPILAGSLLHQFVHGDDAFCNQRLKLVTRIVSGPWIVKAAMGNRTGCLLGKALTCRYYKGENYLEIDVDVGSSTVANAISHVALKYLAGLSIDMGFLIEAQTEEELPERLLGGVRLAHLETSSALFVEGGDNGLNVSKNLAQVRHHNGSSDQEEDDGEQSKIN